MSQRRFFQRLVDLRGRFNLAPELPFSECLTAERIAAVLRELNVVYRDRIYTPCVTLWVFLSQVLSEDHSCRDAVARFLAFRVACQQDACSTDTGSYCQARQRLPEELLARLTRQSGQQLHEQAPLEWRLKGRPVKVVDGSTVSMPDTRQNTAAFDKPRNQRGASGFPVARIVVLLCLATGALLELAVGPCRGKRSGELTLFRQLQKSLRAGDILLGDRLFGTYCDIVRLATQGVDVIFRLPVQRKADFRRGQRLGPGDHLVSWHKPKSRPDWMSREQFQALAAQCLLREVRVQLKLPGIRVRTLTLVTTLLDPRQFSRDELASLFHLRWHAELDLRSIKWAMHMDVLRCKTPEMVRKELWAHLLAYNLLRSVMCAAAEGHGLSVRELSFKGTKQLLHAFYEQLLTSPPEVLESLCVTLLSAVRQHRVGQRPNRYEPRKRKRAAKPYPALKGDRKTERKQCAKKALR